MFEVNREGEAAEAADEPPLIAEEPAQAQQPAHWPPDAQGYYRPCLIAAIAASVGVMVGSVGPWLSALILTVNGLDAGNWGITGLTLGAVSCAALLTVLWWPHPLFSPRWVLPVAWAVVVAGMACLTFALPALIRILTIPKRSFYGLPVGAGAGWGLWLLAMASAVLLVTASIVAIQLDKYLESLPGPRGQPQSRWTIGWLWAAIVASAVIAMANAIYFSANWDNHSGELGLRSLRPVSERLDAGDASHLAQGQYRSPRDHHGR